MNGKWEKDKKITRRRIGNGDTEKNNQKTNEKWEIKIINKEANGKQRNQKINSKHMEVNKNKDMIEGYDFKYTVKKIYKITNDTNKKILKLKEKILLDLLSDAWRANLGQQVETREKWRRKENETCPWNKVEGGIREGIKKNK